MSLRGHKISGTSSEKTVRCLVALIGITHVAFPAHWVRGIITLPEAGTGDFVTWGSDTYERTNLADRLAIGTQSPSAESRIILYGNQECSRSFIVEEVFGLVDVDRPQVQPLPPQFRGRERDRLLGFFIHASYVALVVNPYWVLGLPPHKDILDVFILQTTGRRAGEFDSTLRLATTVLEDAVPATAGSVK